MRHHAPLWLCGVAAAVAGCASSGDGFGPWTDPQLGHAILGESADPPPDAAVDGAGVVAADDLPAAPTAEDYIHVALARHPAIAAAQHRVAAAEARIAQVRSLDDPELMVTPIGEMGMTLDGMPSVMAGVTQRLPFPGKLSARGEAAAAAVEVARSELRATRLRVARETREAYWRYYAAARLVDVGRQGVDLLRQLRAASDAAYRAGGGSQEELLRANMELATLETELVTLEAQQRAARGALNAQMDRPIQAPLPSPSADETMDALMRLEALLARAAAGNPDLATTRRRIDVGRRDLAVAKLERLPNFSVGLQYNVVDRDDAMGPMLPEPSGDDEWWLTFGVSLPIWGGKYDAMATEARSELLARLADLRGESNRVATELQTAALEADTQTRMVRLFRDELLPQSRQALDSSLAGYRAGRTSFDAVVESWRRVLEYERMHHQAYAELQRMLAQIGELVGDEPAAAAAPKEARDE